MCSDFPTFRPFGCAKKKKQRKRDILWKEIETEGKWQKQNKHETNRFCEEKKGMITRREKQGDTQRK